VESAAAIEAGRSPGAKNRTWVTMRGTLKPRRISRGPIDCPARTGRLAPAGVCVSRKPAASAPGRVFLLSPANAAGLRAKVILQNPESSALAARLHGEGAPLGEIFSFISGLYFRGKLAYARAFADPPARAPGIAVITASGGLVSPDEIFTITRLRRISTVAIDPAEPRYRMPLLRDAQQLLEYIGSGCEVVLLGSIATSKYVEPLLSVFGDRLLFPAEFVGRGDMSRGGLMLRCQRAGVQLNYIAISSAVRHGARPPRLAKLARGSGPGRAADRA
jgi:hypothetical protein